MRDVEVMTVDEKDYIIMKEVVENGVSFVFLSGVDDPDDVMIRKSSPTDPYLYIPLESQEEYHLATLLFFKGMNEKNDV